MTEQQPGTHYLKDYLVPDFLIENADLEFNLEERVTTVKSHLKIKKNPLSQNLLPHLILDGDGLELESVLLDGALLETSRYQVTPNRLEIFNIPLTFDLTITTLLRPQDNTALSGLYKSSGNYCTQCEAQGFRRITYFLDRPDVMAKYTTKIIADENKYPVLLSNGNLIARGKAALNKHWVKWEDPFKKPSYLFALVAGSLHCLEDHFITMSGRRITLQIYVETGNEDKCAHAMQAVKKSMRWDEETYGREYDLDIYMIVAVSDFNMGAMENKGLNIFNTKYILARPENATDEDFIHIESVVAHEYFHNWTGNRITCRDWFQLSLKEGLTIFRDQSFTEDSTSATVARIHAVTALRTHQFPEDAGPLAHSVRPESYIEINNFYTSTVYNKGAEVIRMIRTIIGEKNFKQGMDYYFSHFDGQAATIENFVFSMEHVSDADLTQFFRWYTQAGTPTVTVASEYIAQENLFKLHFTQSCPATPNQPQKELFHIPIKLALLNHDGSAVNNDKGSSMVLHLKEKTQTLNFTAMDSKPIPSLLQGYSAPIKLQYDYTDEELEILFKHDLDPFNRWEAGQKYLINLCLRLIETQENQQGFIIPPNLITSFEYVIKQQQDDKYLLSEMLTIPSERYLAEQMKVIDVDALHQVREYLMLNIAGELQELLLQTYEENHHADQAYEFNMEQVGARQLKNKCLFYLNLIPDNDNFTKLAHEQFTKSLDQNMTDTWGALRCLVNQENSACEDALQTFYQHWKGDALVVDKWLSLQGASKLPGTLTRVKKLLQHESFDMKNPNKVYSLIGSFGANMKHFHAADGAGYAFLADMVKQLNVLNPQIAARMIKPLVDWRRYDTMRQEMMVKELNSILQVKNLSKDIYELVSKSLI